MFLRNGMSKGTCSVGHTYSGDPVTLPPTVNLTFNVFFEEEDVL